MFRKILQRKYVISDFFIAKQHTQQYWIPTVIVDLKGRTEVVSVAATRIYLVRMGPTFPMFINRVGRHATRRNAEGGGGGGGI